MLATLVTAPLPHSCNALVRTMAKPPTTIVRSIKVRRLVPTIFPVVAVRSVLAVSTIFSNSQVPVTALILLVHPGLQQLRYVLDRMTLTTSEEAQRLLF